MKLFKFFKRKADKKKVEDNGFVNTNIFSYEDFIEKYPILKQSPYDAIFWSYASSIETSISGGSVTEDAKRGIELYSNGQYFQAQDFIRRASDNGDPMGMNFYGLYKWQINDNSIEAALLFKKAIKQLCTDAMFNLAQLYLSIYRNEQAEVRLQEVFVLYLMASHLGHARSQANLADMYLQGYGVNKDLEEGLKWLYVAVENKDPMALNNLGWFTINGDFGIVKDEVKGFTLLQQAVELGCGYAIPNLAYCYLNGIGVEKDEKRSHLLYMKELENERFYDAIDFFETLATNCYFGRGTEIDYLEAMKCLLRYSIEKDISMYINTWINDRGIEDCRSMIQKSIDRFFEEADNDNKYSQFVCGALLENGEFVERDIDSALYWYNRALRNGHSQALWNYKRLYKLRCVMNGSNPNIILY